MTYNIFIYVLWRFTSIPFLGCILSCSKKNSIHHTPGLDIELIPQREITILGDELHQTIRGFGCATAFNPPSVSAIALNQRIILKNVAAGTFVPYTISPSSNDLKGDEVVVKNDGYTYKIPSMSVVTFVEK